MHSNTDIPLIVDKANATVAMFPPHILRAWAGDLPFDEREEIKLAFTFLQELEDEVLPELRKTRDHRRHMKLHDLMVTVNIVRRYYLACLLRIWKNDRSDGAPTDSEEKTHCLAMTKSGRECLASPMAGSDYCWAHRHEDRRCSTLR